MSFIMPGSTIGLLGSGQLGRMLALAGRSMGYRFVVFSPEANSPAEAVCDEAIVADYTDTDSLASFVQKVDVVTVEFENIPAEALAFLAQHVPVHPGPAVLQTTQHRLREKTWLAAHTFPLASFAPISSVEDIPSAAAQVGFPAVLKTAGFGYDGKGQVRCDDLQGLVAAFDQLDRQPCVLEAWVSLDKELSVIVARSTTGEVAAFGLIENEHRRHILHCSIVPARVSPAIQQQAIILAQDIAEKLSVVGLLCIEFFLAQDGRLLVNELAPRPHNSGHYSINACPSSQFDQHIRAICGLPLGETEPFEPVVMINLLGDLWQGGEPDWLGLLSHDLRIQLHLYGKAQARPGRKMGHFTLTHPDPAQAIALAEAAFLDLQAKPVVV